MRLGIMGGTFDPIHFGHLFIAEEARVWFRLDRVLFVANGTPPHKKQYAVTGEVHRFAMVERATQDNPAFCASRLELDRQGPSYTVETLLALREAEPGAELFYITGADAIAEILTWRRHAEVIRLANFIAAERIGYDSRDLQKRLPPEYLAHILPLPSTMAVGISSTEIRRRLSEGLAVRYLMPDSVIDYIEAHGLYAGADPVREAGSLVVGAV